MKNIMTRKTFDVQLFSKWSLILMVGFLLVLPSFGEAQVKRTKEFNEEYSGKNHVSIAHRRGPLTVKKSEDGKVRVHVKMTVEAKTEDIINTVFDQFKMTDNGSTDHLDLNMSMNTVNWITINGVTKIKFADGTVVKGLKKMAAEFTVWIPDLASLDLENKYDEINIEPNLKGDLKVNLYSGKLYAKDVNGKLDLSMKYGKAYLKNVGDANIDVYENDIEMGNANDVKLKNKYSSIKMGNVTNLTLDMYDGKLEMGNVGKDFEIKDKYSDISLGNFNNGEISLYEGTLIVGNGASLKGDSKYNKLTASELGKLHYSGSYQGKAKIDKLGTLSANSKYTQYEVGTLTNEIDLPDSYQDKILIGNLASGFKEIDLEGKYTLIEIDQNNAKYHLDVEMKYGEVEYDENDLENHHYKKINSDLKIQGSSKGASENSGKMKIRGYKNTLKLD